MYCPNVIETRFVIQSPQDGSAQTEMQYISAGEPMARVPKVARERFMRGTRHNLEIKQICVKSLVV